MEEYYFLFGLAFLWTIFAVVQDLRKTEVANWLNFSLIGFGLAYRGFYSLFSNDLFFFIIGLIGFGIFFVFAYTFYYTRAFAGGDAKLLMGYGIILPYSNFGELITVGIFFVLALFLFGLIYSLVYSLFIVRKNKMKFYREFIFEVRKNLFVFVIAALIFIVCLLSEFNYLGFIFISLIFVSFLYIYLKALDSCMIELVKAKELQEGDWLERDVRVMNKIIKKSVHGLSAEDINILQKARKEVYIKRGIPFTPAFLISLIMVFFFSVLELPLGIFSLF